MVAPRIKKCPLCGSRIPAEGFSFRRPRLGSMRRYCQNCNHVFFDGAYTEIALGYYHIEGFFYKLYPMIFYGPCLLYGMVLLLIDIPEAIALQAPFFPYAIALLLFSFFGIFYTWTAMKALYRRAFKKKYIQKFQREKPDILRGFKKPRELTLIRTLPASIQRLKDRDYLYFLLEHDISIPDFFLEQAGIPLDDFRLLSILDRRAAEKQSQATAERIRCWKQEIEYYEYFLSLKHNSAAFLHAAKENQMSPAGFEAFCRNKIDERQQLILGQSK